MHSIGALSEVKLLSDIVCFCLAVAKVFVKTCVQGMASCTQLETKIPTTSFRKLSLANSIVRSQMHWRGVREPSCWDIPAENQKTGNQQPWKLNSKRRNGEHWFHNFDACGSDWWQKGAGSHLVLLAPHREPRLLVLLSGRGNAWVCLNSAVAEENY
jgi:hypothetical protein